MAKLIEVEGIDGSGKTTAVKYIVEQLTAAGKRVLQSREVGCPYVAACIKLRELVLDSNNHLSGEAMEFIFIAMRIETQKYYAQIAKDYDFIVSDRGIASHVAYTDHNVTPKFTKEVYLDIVLPMSAKPDAIIYINVNPEVASERRARRNGTIDVIEAKGDSYQQAVYDSFDKYLFDGKHVLSNNIYEVSSNAGLEETRQELDAVIKDILLSSSDLDWSRK